MLYRKVQPLPGRINVVITKFPEAFCLKYQEIAFDQTYVVASLDQAIHMVRDGYIAKTTDENSVKVGKVFVIGGAEEYSDALRITQTARLLSTKISADFICDTGFPNL